MLRFCTIVLLLIAGSSDVRAIEFRDCGTKGIILSVDFDNCPDSPCTVHHGDSITGQVSLESDTRADTLSCVVYGIIGGLEAEFPGDCSPENHNPCLDFSVGDCPIDEGEYLVYDINMYIYDSYPEVDGEAKWTLLDEDDDLFMCFVIDFQVLP